MNFEAAADCSVHSKRFFFVESNTFKATFTKNCVSFTCKNLFSEIAYSEMYVTGLPSMAKEVYVASRRLLTPVLQHLYSRVCHHKILG